MFQLSELFRRFAPPPPRESFVGRLGRARELAKRFAATHALSADESAVVLSAFVDSAVSSPRDVDWYAASLRDLEGFRTACRNRGAKGDQEVHFVEERDWPDCWLTEHHLRVVYVPDLNRENGLPRSSDQGAYLQSCRASPAADAVTVCSLGFTHVYARSAPGLWKGTEVDVRETDRPLELKGIGGNFTSTTVVSVDAILAAPTFGLIRELIEQASATCRSDERLWLALGLPVDAGTPIPTPRPIGREEVIDDPIRLAAPAPRLSLEILRATHTAFKPPQNPITVSRIMALERP